MGPFQVPVNAGLRPFEVALQPLAVRHAVPCAEVAVQVNAARQSSAACLFVHVSALQAVLHSASSVGVNGVPLQADALLQTVAQVLVLLLPPQAASVRAAIKPAARIRIRFAMGLPWFARGVRRASVPLSQPGGTNRRP